MSSDLGWGRETFALAIALQNLVWGLSQPFAGMIADKHGAGRVLAAGGVFYCAGLLLMAISTDSLQLNQSAGLLIGFGLSGTSFGVVLGVVGRTFAPEKRSLALGIAGAGGSFGQFFMLPYGQFLISSSGWQVSLMLLAISAGLIVPLAVALSDKNDQVSRTDAAEQTMYAALNEAASHKGFWYLTASFLVCGFQTIFIMIHLPAYLIDQGMAPVTGMTALAIIGLFNVAGSYLCGYFGGIYSKKWLLAWIYLVRAAVISAFIWFPTSSVSVYVFAAIMGFTWLGTVPLTNALVAQIFGVRYISTLFGIVFLGHQIGSFLGAWYGGYIYDLTGSYQQVWFCAIILSILAAAACWPIDERQISRWVVEEKLS